MKAIIKILLVLVLFSCNKEYVKITPSKDLVSLEVVNYRVIDNKTSYDLLITNNNDYDIVWWSFNLTAMNRTINLVKTDTVYANSSISIDYNINKATTVFCDLDSVVFDFK